MSVGAAHAVCQCALVAGAGPRLRRRQALSRPLACSQPQRRDERREEAGIAVAKQRAQSAALVLCSVALVSAIAPEAVNAAASGFAVGGGGADSGLAGDDLYIYTTRDLAVDLVSPLVAYKGAFGPPRHVLSPRADHCLTGAFLLPVVSSLIFKQELPVWLDGIIYVTAIAAAVVVATNSSVLDTYLQ